MKKTYTILIVLILGLKLYANPILLPTILISELYFDNSNNWKLELNYYAVDNQLTFDSIFIFSETNTAKLAKYPFNNSEGFLIITADSLKTEFKINRLGDTIQVVSYCMGMSQKDVLIFGNCPGAFINYPRPNQSISRYFYHWYVKDSSPSLGTSNDSTGICGTINGTIYDKRLNPVSQRKFFLDYQFQTSDNGRYSTRLLSRPNSLNSLTYVVDQNNNRSSSITSINYNMEPDSIIERDIYLLDSLQTGLNDLSSNNFPIRIYPNPASTDQKLTVFVDLPVLTSDIWIEILSSEGKLINKEKVTNKTNLVDTPNKSGTYIVRLVLGRQIITSSKILITHE